MVKVIGHRGSGSGLLENTLQGMKLALAWGVDGIECDVQSSQDGELIVFHDSSLDRLTNGTGLVAEHSLEELKQLKVSNQDRIPTLTELLTLLKPHRDLIIDIDIKVQDIEAEILKELQTQDLIDQTILSSKATQIMRKIRDLNATIETGLIYEYNYEDPISIAINIGCKALFPRLDLVSKELVHACKQNGLKLNPWSINSEEDMRRFIDLGVDWIITDNPQRLLKIQDRMDR
ncbi:MAG: glycerophosphodiester phosphodiesterase [Candidatus Odinarchaeota archaeon]